MSLREWAQAFVQMGAEEVLNLDGGGSTTMWVRGGGREPTVERGTSATARGNGAAGASGRGHRRPRQPAVPSGALSRRPRRSPVRSRERRRPAGAWLQPRSRADSADPTARRRRRAPGGPEDRALTDATPTGVRPRSPPIRGGGRRSAGAGASPVGVGRGGSISDSSRSRSSPGDQAMKIFPADQR